MIDICNPSSDNIKIIPFYGYYLTENGDVFNNRGHKLTPIKNKNYNHFIILTITVDNQKQRQRFNLEKLMLEQFKGISTTRTDMVWYINGNEEDYRLQNLELITKKEYNRRKNKKKKTILSQKDVDEILHKYHGSHNVVNQYDKNYNDTNFYSVRKLAREYNCSGYTIQLVLTGKYKARN